MLRGVCPKFVGRPSLVVGFSCLAVNDQAQQIRDTKAPLSTNRGARGPSPHGRGPGGVPFRPNPLTPFPAREGGKFGGVGRGKG